MKQPCRGEIWDIRLGTGKRGTELDANDAGKERPCLVVSGDTFNNSGRNALTIVPVTTYEAIKEDTKTLWSVVIRNKDHVNSGDVPLPEWRRLRSGTLVPYKSIIDCGHICTVRTRPLLERPSLDPRDPRSDLNWSRYRGDLSDDFIVRVETALQVVIGGDIRYTNTSGQELTCRGGHVVWVNFPEGQRLRYLVVSSTGVDAIRDKIDMEVVEAGIKTGRKIPLAQRSLVPLLPIPDDYNEDDDRGTCIVNVKEQGKVLRELAMCQEIYTFDLRTRNTSPVGDVEEMSRVHQSLREYLDLPR